MKPCCLTTNDLSMEECFSSETRDAGVLVVHAQSGVAGAADALGADRGWRPTCPQTAEDAQQLIQADEDASSDHQTLGAALQAKKHKGLPWWAWIVTGSALGLAIVVGVLQVLEEYHKERVRLRVVKSGAGIEEARRAITRTFGSSELNEALRGIQTPPSSAPVSSIRQVSDGFGSPSPMQGRPPTLSFPAVFQAKQAQPTYNSASPLMQVSVPTSVPRGSYSPVRAGGHSPARVGGFSPMVQVANSQVYEASTRPSEPA